MRRRLLPILVLTTVACSRSDRNAVPAATELVNDSIGQPLFAAWSPDGSRLAWSQPAKGKAAIWVGNADGSRPVQLTHGTWDNDPVWSPDGRWIAYHAEAPDNDIFVVSSDGGEPRQMTSGLGDEIPAGWTADGTGVVYYQTGRGDIQTSIAPLDGGPARPIVAPHGGDQYVAISPDGSKAVIDLHRGAQGTIWVQDLPGGTPHQLTTEGFEDLQPTRKAWAPDSRHVVYTSRRTGTTDLWIADVGTGTLRQLTHDVRNDRGATWSPDGKWIAFVSDRGGQWDIWVIPSAGGQARRVTDDLAVEDAASLQWTRDGQSILYRTTAIEDGLGVTAPDGGAPRMLVDWPGYTILLGDAVLSPDGATVIFASNRSGNFDLWSVPFGGGEPTPFATSPLDETSPQFSPDGSQVLFQSNRSGSQDLWVMPTAGGDARQLTDWPSDETNGRWSPDGSRIAFLSNHTGTGLDIWLVPSSGGNPTRLTRFQATMSSVYWAKDGRSLFAIVTGSTGVNRLYRVPVAGGAPVALQMAPTGGTGLLSPDGTQYAYAALDSGFAFVEVTPTAGGAPRRITRAADNVYDLPDVWSPDGTRLGVVSWVYGGSDATTNVAEVTVSDGAKRELTRFPQSYERPVAYTRDGTRILFTREGTRSRVMSVRIGDLVAREAAPSP